MGLKSFLEINSIKELNSFGLPVYKIIHIWVWSMYLFSPLIYEYGKMMI